MNKPDLSALTGSLKSTVLSVRKSLSKYKRQLLILGYSLGLIALLAAGATLAGLAISRGRRTSVVDLDMALGYSLEDARVLRDLYMPGPGIGETPFPLAFEPDPGYTGGSVAKLYNDMRGIDIGDLTARRKAELEAIYDALD